MNRCVNCGITKMEVDNRLKYYGMEVVCVNKFKGIHNFKEQD